MALRKTLDEAVEAEPQLVREHVTADEYFGMPETLQPHNLIEGRLYLSPSPFRKHQRIVLYIATALEEFEQTHGGEVVLSPMDCKLAEGTVVQPDSPMSRRRAWTSSRTT